MSSPATAAFLKAWRALAPGDGNKRITLAKIELSVPSALTLRYATVEVHTPDGNSWQTGLTRGPIRHAISYLGPGMAPVETWIRLEKRRDAAQSSGTLGTTNQDLLSRYLFQNAIVTLYRWTPALASFSDALQIFKGKVSRPTEINLSGVTLLLLQDQVWNFQLPPTVDKVNYPDSPDVSQGMTIPIVYGDHSAPALLTPWTSAFGSKSQQEDSGGGQGVVPLVLVDAGVGSAAVKLVAAGHAVAEILDRSVGNSAFIVGQDLLNPLDTGGITKTIGSTESYLSIADENAIAYAAIVPIDVRAAGGNNTAGNPRRAMGASGSSQFATLDQNTGKNALQLVLPNVGSLGRIESVQAYVAFRGNAANTHNLRVNTFTPGGAAGGSPPASFASTGTTPTVQVVTWPTAYWSQNWDFGGSATVLDIRVDFVGGTTNKADVFWPVLVVKYRPSRSVVTPGKIVYDRVSHRLPNRSPNDPRNYINVARAIEPSFRLDGQFFVNMKGYKDDGSGTFTGAANSLIERPPDIIRHFLTTYGLISGGNIETGVGATGSFVDARSTLRNGQPTDLKLACWIGERSTVQQVVQKMAQQSGMAVYQDRFTDKWLAFVWKPGAVEDYGYKVSWFELMSIEAEERSVVDTRRAIRVKYAFDHFKSKTLFEAWVNPAGSGQGFNLPTVRDQRLTVVTNVNDFIDFKYNQPPIPTLTTYAIQLSAGTYVPIDLAQHIQALMRTATGTTYMNVGHGFTIKSSFNDKLDFIVAGTPYQATLGAAEYTAEGLAIEAARAMNAVAGHGLTFVWSYDHSVNKFTCTAGSNFQIDGSATSAGFATSATHVMGEYATTAAASTRTMTVTRYGDRFWFGSAGSVTTAHFFNMLWGTGTNVAKNSANLLGTDTGGDSGLVTDNPLRFSRGDRERIAATYDGYYDPREENQIDADWVRDELTAVELRNRPFDLTARPRPVVKLSSYHWPDIRPMQIIELQPDVDRRVSYPRYGSDGSWAGKQLRVLEVEDREDDLIELSVVEA